MSTFALIKVEALNPGEADEEYIRGWRLAETLISMGRAMNAPSPETIVTELAAEGYHDRMRVHEHNEVEAWT